MNSQNESKKFTHEYSRNEITFLDVTVYRNRDKLQVKTFIKPTNKQLYISNSSHHPPGSTKDVAFGKTIRYLRTNSEKKHFYKMLFLHKRNLLKRGYPRSLMNETMRKVRFSMREDRLKPKDQVGTPDRPFFVTRYCSRANNVFRIIRKCWSRLHSQHASISIFINNTLTLAYKSNQSRKLVRAKLKKPQQRSDENNRNSSSQRSTTME